MKGYFSHITRRANGLQRERSVLRPQPSRNPFAHQSQLPKGETDEGEPLSLPSSPTHSPSMPASVEQPNVPLSFTAPDWAGPPSPITEPSEHFPTKSPHTSTQPIPLTPLTPDPEPTPVPPISPQTSPISDTPKPPVERIYRETIKLSPTPDQHSLAASVSPGPEAQQHIQPKPQQPNNQPETTQQYHTIQPPIEVQQDRPLPKPQPPVAPIQMVPPPRQLPPVKPPTQPPHTQKSGITIGKLTVEVVQATAPPVKTNPSPQPKRSTRTVSNGSNIQTKPRYKLSYGLGQL